MVHYSRGSGGSGTETYRIHPTIAPVFTAVNTRSAKPKDVGGCLKVASFNVLNYFATIDLSGVNTAIGDDPRGADSAAELSRQRAKLISAIKILDADVLGLVEIENDFSSNSTGNAIKDLVDGLNAELGADTYSWINPETQFVGDDAIAVGIIYKPAKVLLEPGTSIQILSDANLAGLGLSSSPAVFTGASTNRSPLAATFREILTNEVFTVAVTHFKSKGSVGTAGAADIDQNDGAGNGNQTRLNGVTALTAWLDSDPTGSNDSDFIVLGDFNAYGSEAPIKFMESKGYVDVARKYVGNNAYSYVFDGQVGTLDYVFVSASLNNQVVDAAEWNVNADEADAIDYNLDFNRDSNMFDGSVPYRNSDHDPVIMGLKLNSRPLSANKFMEDDRFNVFPIPANGKLNIVSKALEGNMELCVYNLSGVLMTSKTVNFNVNSRSEIDVSSFGSGTYLLIIKNGQNKMPKLFVKN